MIFFRILIFCFSIITISFSNNLEKTAQDSTKFIAHAGGSIDNYHYTNSLESLDLNYQNGFRMFELDIIKTKDNHYVSAHDWKYWKKITGYKNSIPPTLEEFKKFKIHKKYTPMDIDEINNWFEKHSDAILVTDKINEPKKFSKKFKYKNRLMMELFSWDAVDEANEEKIFGVMPSYFLVKKIKNNKIKFLLQKNIHYIAVSRNYFDRDAAFLKELKENNIKTFAFHVNLEKEFDEKYMLCNEMDIFYGIYADSWNFPQRFDSRNCTAK